MTGTTSGRSVMIGSIVIGFFVAALIIAAISTQHRPSGTKKPATPASAMPIDGGTKEPAIATPVMPADDSEARRIRRESHEAARRQFAADLQESFDMDSLLSGQVVVEADLNRGLQITCPLITGENDLVTEAEAREIHICQRAYAMFRSSPTLTDRARNAGFIIIIVTAGANRSLDVGTIRLTY